MIRALIGAWAASRSVDPQALWFNRIANATGFDLQCFAGNMDDSCRLCAA